MHSRIKCFNDMKVSYRYCLHSSGEAVTTALMKHLFALQILVVGDKQPEDILTEEKRSSGFREDDKFNFKQFDFQSHERRTWWHLE